MYILTFIEGGGGAGMVSIGLYNLMSFVFDVLSTINYSILDYDRN